MKPADTGKNIKTVESILKKQYKRPTEVKDASFRNDAKYIIFQDTLMQDLRCRDWLVNFFESVQMITPNKMTIRRGCFEQRTALTCLLRKG